MLDTFFREEFQLDYLLSKIKPVQISIWDGMAMGGGVGLTVNSKVIVVTENTVFAMPEVKIGFVTDVGASYFLPRMPYRVGIYLGITGDTLTGKELMQLGIAHHYVSSDKIGQMKQDLQSTVYSNTNLKSINSTIS